MEVIAPLNQLSSGDILIVGSAPLVKVLMETDLIDEYRFFVQSRVMGGESVSSKMGWA